MSPRADGDRWHRTVLRCADALAPLITNTDRERKNGRRYYVYEGQPLVTLPERESLRPSPKALEWHFERVFRR